MGSRLHQARLDQSLTVSELADKAGVSERTVYRVEAEDDKRGPSVDTVKRLAGALGVSAAWLMGWDDGEGEE